ncbi:hypothetical protein HMSP1_94 [Sinorhizobium phage HMSP1-Susan]|nr:hypothetical protein HMSP1_94 [Sinorhizobium phage HMSP1-Susan]
MKAECLNEQKFIMPRGIKFIDVAPHPHKVMWINITYEEQYGPPVEYTLYALRRDWDIPDGAEFIGRVGTLWFYVRDGA